MAPRVDRFIVLAAELDPRRPAALDFEVALDGAALARAGRPIGLALRVTSTGADLDARFVERVGRAALGAIAAAEKAGLRVAELQLDFDASRSQLPRYAAVLWALRTLVAPTPLYFTALPDWLRTSAFGAVAGSADGYVLQVHALPARAGPRRLCDPAAALRATRRAASFGVPFRVALPTYAYEVGRDPRGRVVGVAADGPEPRWPEGTRVERLAAEPEAMRALARAIAAERDAEGITWFRLPIGEERRNWPLQTFAAVLEDRVPRRALRAEPRAADDGRAFDLLLVDDGETAEAPPTQVHARFEGELVAADGLHGYRWMVDHPSSGRFIADSPSGSPLRPGERRVFGWLRFAAPAPPPSLTLESASHP